MVVKVNGHRVRLTVGSPFVFVDARGTNLLAPVRWHEDRVVVPVRLATEVLDPLVTEGVTWNRSICQLRLDTGDPNVLAIDFDVRRNGTVAEIRLAEPLTGTIDDTRGDRLVVRIPGGVLADGAEGEFSGIGLVDKVVSVQEPGTAILSFHLGLLGGTGELMTRASPPRLVLAVSEGSGDDIPPPKFERRNDRPRGKVRVVVIDPGHGGSDAGIRSAGGASEKEIALDLARRVREILEDRTDLEVHLTREDDQFLSVRSRTEAANGHRPDLFLSLHHNGWFHEGMRGFSAGVFRESEGASTGEFNRWGEPSALDLQDSELLAEILLDSLDGVVAMPNRGVKRAEYAVLGGSVSPAVLLECGFLTNRRGRRAPDGSGASRRAGRSDRGRRGGVRSRARERRVANAMSRRTLVYAGVAGVLLLGALLFALQQEEDTLRPSLADDLPGTRTVDLFFPDGNGKLVRETREILGTDFLEEDIRHAVDELLAGGSTGVRAIPPSTRLLNAYYDGEGEVTLNFTAHLRADHPGGSAAEISTVRCIVSSIGASFPGVDTVRILIEGEAVRTLAGHVDLSEPLKVRNYL